MVWGLGFREFRIYGYVLGSGLGVLGLRFGVLGVTCTKGPTALW